MSTVAPDNSAQATACGAGPLSSRRGRHRPGRRRRPSSGPARTDVGRSQWSAVWSTGLALLRLPAARRRCRSPRNSARGGGRSAARRPATATSATDSSGGRSSQMPPQPSSVILGRVRSGGSDFSPSGGDAPRPPGYRLRPRFARENQPRLPVRCLARWPPRPPPRRRPGSPGSPR